MANKAGFEIAISEIVEEASPTPGHPFQTVAKFVFADDKPNANKQAVSHEEFENIKNSAIGMPVKISFSGESATDHTNSIPIGVIRSIEEVTLPDDTHQLLAEAILWGEEYPDEVAYLKTAFAGGKAPGISYELGFKDSEVLSGVQWLKSVITLAATFVREPAYGRRTPLIALASLQTPVEYAQEISNVAKAQQVSVPEIIESLQGLEDIGKVPSGKPSDEGGTQMEEELKDAKATAASLTSEIEGLRTQLTERDSVIATRDQEINDLKQSALIGDRARQYVEAGFALEAEAAEKKKSLWSSLNDEQWTEYLADLVDAKKSAPKTNDVTPAMAAISRASASNAMPKLEPEAETGFNALTEAMRQLARPHSA